ncbi:hypothetical protein ACIVBQ_001505 [Tenacibaculum discolor]
MRKLKLNKEKIASLTNENAMAIQGGGTAKSTDRTFTCCWCTDTDSDNCTNKNCGPGMPYSYTNECPDPR